MKPLRARISSPFVRAARWIAAFWRDIRPGPEARKGALWAAIATVIWAAIVGGINLKSGFGVAADLLFAFLIAALGIPLVAAVYVLLLAILRRLPRWTTGFFVGALVFLSLLWFGGSFGYSVAAILLVIEACLGATIATLVTGNFARLNVRKKVATISICVLAVAANVWVFLFLHNDGITEKLIQIQQNSPAPATLNAPNPSDRGSYSVQRIIYGSGTDIRRPEFGKSVPLRTSTVDAGRFFKDFKGWKASLRKRYWGFGMDKLPINGRVWYPAGPGPFPLVLMVHGNHVMSEFSDTGYAYLGELLASRGFIFVSVDENFINSGLFHNPPKEQAVRGWLLLEHLKVWQKWNHTTGNPFFGKVDWNNVALMGHSRGGEAAATAALFNKLWYYPDDATITFHYGFPIKSIVAIAPADGQYKPAGQWRTIEDINYFTIQGANDADVSSFMGSRQWDHVRFSGNGDFFKSELYIYRANHGQFNTVWGRTDFSAPVNWFLNLQPLLPGQEQRRIAKIYIAAFLEATLHNRREYVPLFEDYRTVRNWLPRTLYVSRYADSTDRVITNFNEDPDVTTTTMPGGHISAEHLTVWKEGRIPFRHGDRDYNGVFLGWNREGRKPGPVASYSVDLPQGTPVDGSSALTLSIAVTDENAPPPGKDKKPEDKKANKDESSKPQTTDFTVVARSQDGAEAAVPLSRFGTLLPPIKVKFTKLDWLDTNLYSKSSEPIFQSITIPLSAFAAQNPRLDISKLRRVAFRFDRTPERVIIVSEIGISKVKP